MIGVFDSGHGGLTVLSALTKALPDERFLYLGDNAYAPYGMRSSEEIFQLCRRRIADLFSRGCDLVIIACNTASAVALRRLQTEWLPTVAPEKRILGVFIPAIEALTERDWYVRDVSPYKPPRPPRTVGVFATRRTVESKAFVIETKSRAPEIQIIQQPCPRLAEAIEQGLDDVPLRQGVARYVEQLLAKAGRTPLDLVVLGCTHYPLVEDAFRAALPPGIRILNQAEVAAAALTGYLDRHPTFRRTEHEAPGVTLLTSGDPDGVSAVGSRFFGAPTPFQHLSGPVGTVEPGPEATPETPAESEAI
jgi:glutamate racemase